jgi:hypothetical protein
MSINLSMKGVKNCLLAIWLFLVVAGFFTEYAYGVFHVRGSQLVKLFCLGYEQNVPTWYVSALLLLCALLLGVIAITKRQNQERYVAHWWILGAAFLHISVDETAKIHEIASSWFDLGGFLYYGWVIPGGIIVTTMGLCYLPFLAHLPRKTRLRFTISGLIYVGGALGVEMIGASWAEHSGSDTIMFGMLALLEEALEILGVTCFLIALIQYITHDAARLNISLKGNDKNPSSEEGGQRDEVGIARAFVSLGDGTADVKPVCVGQGQAT